MLGKHQPGRGPVEVAYRRETTRSELRPKKEIERLASRGLSVSSRQKIQYYIPSMNNENRDPNRANLPVEKAFSERYCKTLLAFRRLCEKEGRSFRDCQIEALSDWGKKIRKKNSRPIKMK